MFETRKYMDYELAYKMFKKCEKLLEKGINELDDYFEEEASEISKQFKSFQRRYLKAKEE